MKTVILNFTQPGNKEVLLLLAPDDMDVQAEIAECRTRSHRSLFSRENRPATVYNWLIDRGCRAPDELPVMIDGWHEPPMTRPRSENCNVPLVTPYIRLQEVNAETAEAWNRATIQDEFSSINDDGLIEAIDRATRRVNRPAFPGVFGQLENGIPLGSLNNYTTGTWSASIAPSPVYMTGNEATFTDWVEPTTRAEDL